MGCSSSTHRQVASPIEQAETKATAKDEKSWTEIPGVDPPVRLVVNATSQSQVSSNPILGSEAAPGPRRRPTVDVYKGAVFPPNEAARMETFNAIGLGSAPQDPATARLCHVLSKLLQVSCCNLHFINEGVFQINTSQCGLTGFKQDYCPETLDRKLSLCAWTLLPESPEVLIVPDALQDVRFRDHPIIKGEPFFRFYAGCPLVTFQGFRIGTVCCLDGQPHTLTVQDCNMLCNFAELVVREVEKKHVAGEMKVNPLGSVPEKSAALDYYSEGMFIVDASQPRKCNIVWLNTICRHMIGVDDDKAYESSLADFYQIADSEEGAQLKREEFARCIQEGAEVIVRACKCKTGSTGMADLHFRPVTSEKVDDQMPLIGIPSIIKPAGASAATCTHYFVSVRPTACEQPTPPVDAPHAPASAEACELPRTTTLAKLTPSVSSTLDGVTLGQFIIKTHQGRVFRGVYNGEAVTVKVVEQQVQGEAVPQLAEARLTDSGLAHPNIILTHKILSRTRTTGRSQLRRYKAKKSLVPEGGAASEQAKPKSQILEFWLVREYCDKGSLMDAMERGWFMTEDSVMNSEPTSDLFAVYATAKDVACAMAYIHSKGIIHGDLQGDALGLISSSQDPRGFIVKVWDFDVAVTAQKEPVPCNTDIFSLAHMAPESITEKHLTKASDVYAFGVMLWELMSGEEAWLGLSNEAITTTVTQQKTQLKFKEGHPAPYTELALECMAHDPASRPTFQQIEDRLAKLQASVQPMPGKGFLRSGGSAAEAAG